MFLSTWQLSRKHPYQLGHGSWRSKGSGRIHKSCLEESIRGSMAPVFNASWCVQTFQVYPMILNHPGGYMSSRCVYSRCVHSRWIQGLQVCPPYKASMWVQAIQVCPGELNLGVSICKTEWNSIIKCNFSVHSSNLAHSPVIWVQYPAIKSLSSTKSSH